MKKIPKTIAFPVIAMITLVAFAPGAASAGRRVPPVELADIDGKARTLPDRADRAVPVLVVCEGRDERDDNQAFKERLGALLGRADNAAKARLVAVADLARWNWWPAKRHALASIRDGVREGKIPKTIHLDWEGKLRRGWGIAAGRPAMLLVDGEGEVLFAAEGRMSEAEQRALLEALGRLGVNVSGGAK